MKKYVLGFLFNSAGDAVTLIEKETPEWQRGMLNGIEGKVEEKEYPIQAITREFKEEAGVEIHGWEEFAVMTGVGWRVYCYKYFSDSHFSMAHTAEKEVVLKLSTFTVDQYSRIDNLLMLIAMAQDKSGVILPIRLTYGD